MTTLQLWATIKSNALVLMTTLLPVVALVFGIALSERLLPYARRLVIRAGTLLGIRPRASGAVHTAKTSTRSGGG